MYLKHFLSCLFLAAVLEKSSLGAEPTILPDKQSQRIYAIQIQQLPRPDWPDYPVFQAILKDHPQIHYARVTQLNSEAIWGGNLLMSIAGGTAPDILLCPDEPKSWIRQGFFEPLDQYIYRDINGDGRYTEGIDEVIWEPFLRMHPKVRDAIIENGHIYVLPWYQWIQFLMYRKDIFAEQGIDPEKRIETFDELKYVCQKLTDPKVKITGARRAQGRKGIGIAPGAWYWQGWLYASGGEMVKYIKTCPRCQASNEFPEHEEKWLCQRCNTSLKDVAGKERAAFNSPAGRKTLKLWQDLLWAPFIKCPYCGEPVELGDASTKLTFPLTVTCPHCQKTVELASDKDVIIGCARPLIGDDSDWFTLWQNGEIAIMTYYSLHSIVESNLDSRMVGAMPLPEKGGSSAFHYSGVYSGTKEREGGMDRVRVCAEYLMDYVTQFYVPKDDPRYLNYDKARVAKFVDAGFFNICSYDELVAAGLEEYAKEIAPGSREMQRLMREPNHYTIQPLSEHFLRVREEAIENVMLSGICFSPDYDIEEQLRKAEEIANTQVFMKDEIVQDLLKRHQMFFVIVIILLIAFVTFLTFKLLVRKDAGIDIVSHRKLTLGKRAVCIFLLLPAIFLVGLWSYYPLIRGSVMAFQDVKIMGESRFVNIENFIRVISNPQFVIMIKATLVYVFAVLSLGFFAPVILGILLSEIKRGSVFFRVIYYSPYVLGGVVVLFIWKIFYMPTSEGMLNHLLGYIGLGPIRWLQDPRINKWALVLPSVWAGTGAGCLVYLAALKSIDDELYEVADIDGAGIWAKCRYITIPSLKPLLIINFVGTVIGAFRGMGNILILTGGQYETNVIGLQIFMEAFAYLRYGSATALAWILGSFLIGFTILQLRILKKVEFRRAE